MVTKILTLLEYYDKMTFRRCNIFCAVSSFKRLYAFPMLRRLIMENIDLICSEICHYNDTSEYLYRGLITIIYKDDDTVAHPKRTHHLATRVRDIRGNFDGTIVVGSKDFEFVRFLESLELLLKPVDDSLITKLDSSTATEVMKMDTNTIGDVVKLVENRSLDYQLDGKQIMDITVVLEEMGIDMHTTPNFLIKAQRHYQNSGQECPNW